MTTSMTILHPDPRRPVLVRADEAERLDSIGHVLLADSSTTGGALSSHRIALARGADGARPHRHDQACELFFILSGQLDVLAGDEVITTAVGDLLVVPAGLAHAFGAHRGSAAEALVIIIPIHLYWALGGTWGLPGAATTAGLPGLRATNAIVSVLLAVGAALVFGLSMPWARRPPAMVMLTPLWLGSVVSVSHGLYGMVTKGLFVAGAQSAVSYPEPLTAAQKNHAALLDLGLFEPWFLIQGLLLLLAGRWFARTAAGRRWWTLSLIAAVVLVDAFGIALAVARKHFTLS